MFTPNACVCLSRMLLKHLFQLQLAPESARKLVVQMQLASFSLLNLVHVLGVS